MRRYALLASLGILLLACTLGLPGFGAPTAPAATRTPTKKVTPTRTPTITPMLPTPTFSPTPTPLGGAPSETPTSTDLPTDTPFEIGTPVTPTPIQQNVGFVSVILSEAHIYWGACEPDTTTITARVTEPGLIYNVVVFVRLRQKNGTDETGWDTGRAMNDKGDGTFTYQLKAESIEGYANYASAWVYYQLVSTDRQNNIIGRTQVYTQSLTLSPCK